MHLVIGIISKFHVALLWLMLCFANWPMGVEVNLQRAFKYSLVSGDYLLASTIVVSHSVCIRRLWWRKHMQQTFHLPQNIIMSYNDKNIGLRTIKGAKY